MTQENKIILDKELFDAITKLDPAISAASNLLDNLHETKKLIKLKIETRYPMLKNKDYTINKNTREIIIL